MDREELILKWLEGKLNETELKAFQQLEEYDSYVKLYENAGYFKSPRVNKDQGYQDLKSKLSQTRPRQRLANRMKPLLRIAAVLVVGLGIYFGFFNRQLTRVEASISENTALQLPDASAVVLNAASSLRYNNNDWDKKRKVYLQGEAYFKVAKGATFEVTTKTGTVTVLGTQFNVKHRKNLLEVQCFEGSVSVNINDNIIKLQESETLQLVNSRLRNGITSLKSPSWINGKSDFESIPYREVLDEFERQYKVKITIQGINTAQLFTGSFVHNNKKLALKSITQPFKLNYDIEDNVVKIAGHD